MTVPSGPKVSPHCVIASWYTALVASRAVSDRSTPLAPHAMDAAIDPTSTIVGMVIVRSVKKSRTVAMVVNVAQNTGWFMCTILKRVPLWKAKGCLPS